MKYYYQYHGKQGQAYAAEVADDLIVVRTRQHKSLTEAVRKKDGKQVLSKLIPIARFDEADVTILKCMDSKNQLQAARDEARHTLKKESDIRFAGRVLQEENQGNPV
ncbi:MAG: hypothetical protein GY707_07610, partial [Desulfobacteraceae bacterium]|nr:hypothetical protein [Desulfobacteraceae bacterium]